MNPVLALFWSFLKMGCVGYGGGPSMVPLIKEEVVNLQAWIALPDFMDVLAIGNALPGPIATKLSVAIGFKVAGFSGALAATVGVVVPSCVVLILLLSFVSQVKDNPQVKHMLKGVRPVVVAMLAYAAYDMSFGALVGFWGWCIALSTLGLMVFTKIHPAIFIIAGALVGAGLHL